MYMLRAINGWVEIRMIQEWVNACSHSRGPGGLPAPAGGSARSAKVTGPPSTSRIGASIDSSMCTPMCTLNIAIEYRPMPDDVATRMVAQPVSQATVRPTGQVVAQQYLGSAGLRRNSARRCGLAQRHRDPYRREHDQHLDATQPQDGRAITAIDHRCHRAAAVQPADHAQRQQ